MKKNIVSICFPFALLFGLFLYNENILQKTANKNFSLIKNVVKSNETENINFESRNKNPSAELYKVDRIVDGDTLVVQINGKLEKVRLIGINTPETIDPREPVECFGKEASDEAKRILTGESIRLESDPSQDSHDKYGRLLAYVFLPDGTNFNRLMIKNGYGYEYTYNIPYKYQKDFKQAEKEAGENKQGLWEEGVCSKNF